jgi:hypothetical protein
MSATLPPGERRTAFAVALLLGFLVLLAGLQAARAQSVNNRLLRPQPPAAAEQYRADVVRSAYRVHGPGAPVAMRGGHLHQESAWDANARSRVGAMGLGQFMPLTAEDMAKHHPAECAPANPFSARWAIECSDLYLRSLRRQMRPMTRTELDECTQWVFTLRAYNGGAGWVMRDRSKARDAGADPDDWQQVARFNAGRSAGNFKENTEYAPRIMRLQERYRAWGRSVCNG